MIDPLDQIARICAEQPEDALSRIADVLGFKEQQPEPGADERALKQAVERLILEGKTVDYVLTNRKNPDDARRCFAEAADRVTKLLAAQSGQRAGVAEELSADDVETLRKAVRQFNEYGETEVSYDDCMRFATMGLLDCDAFILSDKGAKFLAAAPTQQQEGGNV